MDLWLATCPALPSGEPGAEHLDNALRERGIAAAWASWDDANVDWGSAPVAIRATWDYAERPAEFRAWVDRVPRLLNGPEVVGWNLDKRYLLQLAPQVPVIETAVVLDPAALPASLAGPHVIKPVIGAGGRGLVVVGPGAGRTTTPLGPGPWLVQPLVESVRTEGELSVYVMASAAVSAFCKIPPADDIRAHEERGARVDVVPISPEARSASLAAVAAASRLVGTSLSYARVDLLRRADGVLAVSELELIEPGLYLDVDPVNAEPFADLLADWVSRGAPV